MLSCRRKPLAALATGVTALAITVPAATASAATTTTSPTVNPQVCQLLDLAEGPFGPAQFPIGGASLGAVLNQAGASVNCPAPAPQQSLFPTLPLLPTLP